MNLDELEWRPWLRSVEGVIVLDEYFEIASCGPHIVFRGLPGAGSRAWEWWVLANVNENQYRTPAWRRAEKWGPIDALTAQAVLYELLSK